MTKVKALSNFNYAGYDRAQGDVFDADEEQLAFLTGEGVNAVQVVEDEAEEEAPAESAGTEETPAPEAPLVAEQPAPAKPKEETPVPTPEGTTADEVAAVLDEVAVSSTTSKDEPKA